MFCDFICIFSNGSIEFRMQMIVQWAEERGIGYPGLLFLYFLVCLISEFSTENLKLLPSSTVLSILWNFLNAIFG